jgi:hypothetical protein
MLEVFVDDKLSFYESEGKRRRRKRKRRGRRMNE